MSSSLLLQQCPACLVRLTLIVFVIPLGVFVIPLGAISQNLENVQLVLCGMLPPGTNRFPNSGRLLQDPPWSNLAEFGKLETKGRTEIIQTTTLLKSIRILRKVLETWLVGWLVVFYGISTLVGYLMPSPVYIYIHTQRNKHTYDL